MSQDARMPVDLLHRPEVRALDPGVVLRLWLELAVLGRTTGRIGFLPESVVGRPGAPIGFEDLGSMAGEYALLRPVDKGWECPLFLEYNRHLDPDFIQTQRKGSLARSVSKTRTAAAAAAARELHLLPPESFKRADGSVVDAETMRKARTLIRMLDNVLGHRERAPYQVGQGLLHTAVEIVETRDEAIVNEVLTWVLHVRNQGRSHPAIPPSAEQALAQWKTLEAAATPE